MTEHPSPSTSTIRLTGKFDMAAQARATKSVRVVTDVRICSRRPRSAA